MKPIRRKIRPIVKFDFEELEAAPTLVDLAKELLQKSNHRITVSKQLLSRGDVLDVDSSGEGNNESSAKNNPSA